MNLADLLSADTGNLKMVGGGVGTADFSTTGVKLTITPAADQKVVLSGSISSLNDAVMEIKFAGNVVYSGLGYPFFVQNLKPIGGIGEELIIEVSSAGTGNSLFSYAYQLLEKE